jgi:hypothetical protein
MRLPRCLLYFALELLVCCAWSAEAGTIVPIRRYSQTQPYRHGNTSQEHWTIVRRVWEVVFARSRFARRFVVFRRLVPLHNSAHF